MLARAVRRKVKNDPHRNLQTLLGQLQLPWLCPALWYDYGGRRNESSMVVKKPITIAAPLSPKPQPVATAHHRLRHRGFAYAATIEHGQSQDPFVPFDIPGQSASSGNSGLAWLGEDDKTPFTFDPLSPLVINDSLTRAPRKFRALNGVGGEVAEIRRTLQACLQVGRLDRAATTMRRLNMIFKPDTPELTHMHNDYIATLVERIVRTKDQELLKHVQKWFEVDLRGKGIKPDPTTFSHMIRAAFQESKQLKIDRTIRRYIDMADKCGIGPEAMGATLSVLNEQQIGRVTRIAPMTFHPVSDDVILEEEKLSSLPMILDTLDSETTEAPQVRSHKQKGMGLKALQKALSLFSDQSPVRTEGSQEEKGQDYAFQRQTRLEQDVLSSALDRWRAEQEDNVKRNGSEGNLSSVGSLMWQWHELLTPLIKQEVTKVKEAESNRLRGDLDHERCLYGPYIQFINPEKLSAVTILTLLRAMSLYGVDRPNKITTLANKIGYAVQIESTAESLKNIPSLDQRGKRDLRKTLSPRERSHKLASLVKKVQSYESVVKAVNAADHSSLSLQEQNWSSPTRIKVGALLLSFLLKVAKMTIKRQNPETGERTYEKQLVFWNSHQYSLGRRIGVLRINPALTTKLTKEPVSCVLARHMPMVVEPRPWTSHKEGAFLYIPSLVVRVGAGQDQIYRYIRAAAEGGDLDQLFAGLNVLGKTPWKINRGIFDVMIKVWDSGEALVDFPPEDPKFEYPPEPDLPHDNVEHQRWASQVKAMKNERMGLHSQRCYLNFVLEVARSYLNETMYFPHNVDFRGRAYPMSPYLNHMSGDYCRGLLLFAKGKELGPTGLTWLKIHLANVAGFDKASLEERRDFSTSHLADIYDSAMKPLNGNRWWLKAEDPWQCLAACIELKNALDSPDPTKFVSFLAVHQDGTCNGLQHYAALGGDAIGAKQVNLEPGNRPSDIYTAVAELVKKDLIADAAQDDELARFLENKVTRKVVKTTVMTNVYGVTFIGARNQVRKNLSGAYPDFPSTTTVNLNKASHYIAKKIFKALASMFNGARDIQIWLGECASRICESLTPEQMDWIERNAQNKIEEPQFALGAVNERTIKDEHMRFKTTVIWTTPLKMPVVQPYRKTTGQYVITNLQKMSISDPSVSDSIVKRKQLQAFPPNFIHSLDATHMMLSALKSDENGLTFAAVHDSFWTHAGDVDKLNTILRDAFIRMHSEDIVGRLATEFSTRYKGCLYLASVKANSEAGKKITEYRAMRTKELLVKRQKGKVRAKKHSVIDELLLEQRRSRLLASEDPAARTEGESMITPATIIAETGDEDFALLEDFEGGIGKISDAGEDELQNEASSVDDIDSMNNIESTDSLAPAYMVGGDLDQTFEPVEEDIEKEAKKKVTRKVEKKLRIWLPLTFPAVPKKGDFDVSKLRQSPYFFS